MSESEGIRLRIAGMDCGDCALTIEKSVSQLQGVEHVNVNFTTELMEIRGEVSLDTLRRRVEALGYQFAQESERGAHPRTGHGISGFLSFLWAERHSRGALLLGLVLVIMAPLQLALATDSFSLFVQGLELAAIIIVGYPIASRGVRSLVYARRITIDLLIATAAIGAVAIGAVGEAVTVVLLFTLGETLEAYSAERSRDSLRGLLELRPEHATVMRPRGASALTEQVPVDQLRTGDQVLVKPGARLPADGYVIEGASDIDEASITGESVPVNRGSGDTVFAGTINGRGTLVVGVSRPPEEFTISQIARLVEQAQTQRSPAERYVDRFARWYTPAVVLLALAVATLPPLVLGQTFLGDVNGAPGWLYRGLALLIVACPCALVISIPVTVVSALTRLAQLGVLVKGGALLDELARVAVFAFDKTGTLTRGEPVVAGTRSRDCRHEGVTAADCGPCDNLVAIAASVESGSEHPFAQAVVSAAERRRVEQLVARATEIEAHTGRGVSGTLNGRRVTVGNAALFHERFDADPEGDLKALLDQAGSDDRSVMLVAEDDRVLGYIQVADKPRTSSQRALETLREMDPGYRFVMLTGDRREVAASMSEQLGGMDEIQAELMPDEKMAAVRGLEARYGPTAMVGDGINDAPALAAARLGVAMGAAGSPQAMEVADVVLMQDDLSHLPMAVGISRKTRRLIRENIALSLGLKLAFLALAIPGIATLWMAVLADVGTTVMVTLNGMRILRFATKVAPAGANPRSP